VLASFITGIFVVVGVSAFWLLRGRNEEQAPARTAFSLCLWLAAILLPLQIFVGDQHGLNTRKYQPMKLAAIEARSETDGGVPLTASGWPDEKAERNEYAVEIPLLGSIILTHSLNCEVKGLKEVPASERPPVLPVFFAFRIMVGCGMALLGLALLSLYLRWRHKLFSSRCYLYACLAGTPLVFVATLAGGTVTEVGRQPYVIYGQLRTADAVSPIAGGAVFGSLAVALVLYNLLLLGFFYYGSRLVWRGFEIETPIAPIGRPLGAIHAAIAARNAIK